MIFSLLSFFEGRRRPPFTSTPAPFVAPAAHPRAEDEAPRPAPPPAAACPSSAARTGVRVHLRTVRKSFGGTCVIRGLSGVFHPGVLTGIVGPSGGGKSTILNLLGGFIHPDAGSISFFDRDGERATPRVAVVLQNSPDIVDTLPCLHQVALPLLAQGLSWTPALQRAARALSEVGLGGVVHRLPSTLSGGQRQRLVLARARVQDADLILADEPTANLDQANAEQVLEVLKRLAAEGRTVIIVSHDRRLIFKHAGIVYRLDAGTLHRHEPTPRPVSSGSVASRRDPHSNSITPNSLNSHSSTPGACGSIRVEEPRPRFGTFAVIPVEPALLNPWSGDPTATLTDLLGRGGVTPFAIRSAARARFDRRMS